MTHAHPATPEEAELRRELDAILAAIAAGVAARRGYITDADRARDARRLVVERRLAALRGEEHAEPAPGAELPFKPYGEVHVVDGEPLQVVVEASEVELGAAPVLALSFAGCAGLRVDRRDFTAYEAQPLHGRGLGLVGLHVVRASRWQRDFEAADDHGTKVQHFVLRWKDGQIEVLAAGLSWRRVALSMLEVRRRLDEVKTALGR